MQAGIKEPTPKQKTTSRNRLSAFLLISLSVGLFLSGSGRSASGNVSPPVNIGVSRTQNQNSSDGIWEVVDRTTLKARAESASPRAYQLVELHEDSLLRVLAGAPMEFTEAAKSVQVVVSLPMPEGTFGRFRIEESPVMEPALAAQFPEVKSYRGQGVDDPAATTRFDLSPNGFHAIVLSPNGTVFIDRYTADDNQNYISFYKEDLQEGFQPPQCEVTEAMQDLRDGLALKFGPEGFAPDAFVGATLRTYRLALATTVEYTNNATYGGTKSSTLTKLNTIVNLINAIYEREVSIRFQLVASELSIIFDTEPDGYTNSSVGTMLNENPTVLNATIGSGAYDIGHVFGLSSAGSSSGVAQLSVVCGGSKGRGASVLGIALVTGNFSIDSGLVAHEWGHQFSASHTFNSISNFCGSAGQRSASTAYEPGSGSTLMAYPGVCSPENLQSNSDNYFLGGSFDQIASYSAGTGASCAAATATGNNPPTVSAGLDYTIPMGTPFTLTATASDPDGNSLTYSWEELDTGTASPPMTDDGTRPLFRSLPAVTSPSRTFPKLSSILNNTTTIGETLPITTRTMNLRVTARDNRAAGGGVNSDAMILNVTSASGPFVVTQPDTAVTWTGGSSRTVSWNVANTSSPPVNCALVRLALSTDGGNTFPLVLAASTPNDGAETIVIPNISTTTARIKVEALANVFFDVSNTNFTVTQTTGNIQATVQTNPAGRSFTVDGTTYSTSQTISWASGSSHTIATSSPQSGGTGTQYAWSAWSDGGSISHNVAPTVNVTYTANFTTQYFLTMSAGAGGTVSPLSNWFNSGQSVPITATPNSGFGFSGWTGGGVGSFTGLSNPASVTMNGPISESASFTLFGLDTDGDCIPDVVELSEGTNPLVKDNDIFNNARLFAMQQYRDYLGREGDPSGITYWTNLITSGQQTRAQVIDSFFNSPEFQAVTPVARLYFAYFLRIPDYGGLLYWVNLKRNGMSLDTISESFAQSPEFITRYGSLNNADFVTLVYQNVLGRAPDAGGFAYWTGLLDNGIWTRGQVMVGFSESPEFVASSSFEVYVTQMYVGMLRRSAEQGGFDYWVHQMELGRSGLDLINGFLLAPEYRNRFLP